MHCLPATCDRITGLLTQERRVTCVTTRQFTDPVLLKQPHKVTLGDAHQVEAAGRGTVTLDMELTAGKTKKCTLKSVLYVPELTFSLVSVSKAPDKIGRAVFTNQGCDFLDAGGKAVVTGRKVGALYYLNCTGKQQSARVTQESAPEQIWHRLFVHMRTRSLKKLEEQDMVDGLGCKITKKIGDSVCEPCAEGKQCRSKFPQREANRSDTVLGLVHSGLCGN